MTGLLVPAERMALTVARAQVERGETPTPNVACVVVMALSRINDLVGDKEVFIVCPDCDGNGAIWTMAANPTLDETEQKCTRCEQWQGMVRLDVGGAT